MWAVELAVVRLFVAAVLDSFLFEFDVDDDYDDDGDDDFDRFVSTLRDCYYY